MYTALHLCVVMETGPRAVQPTAQGGRVLLTRGSKSWYGRRSCLGHGLLLLFISLRNSFCIVMLMPAALDPNVSTSTRVIIVSTCLYHIDVYANV